MTPKIFGKSVQGDSHIRRGVERQDSYVIIDSDNKRYKNVSYFNDFPSEVKIVAVADGHGSDSCPYSKTGSQTAANAFCAILSEYAKNYRNNMPELFALLNREGDTTALAKKIILTWQERIKSVHNMNKRPVPTKETGERDDEAIWKQYGTTLLGMFITPEFIFFFQLGDGDIMYVDENEVTPVIIADKMLGVETHSISKKNSWQKVLTRVVPISQVKSVPYMYTISTDGWVNSHASEEDFKKTCMEYLQLMKNKGTGIVEDNLEPWLAETSRLGCGDDITVVFVYYDE